MRLLHIFCRAWVAGIDCCLMQLYHQKLLAPRVQQASSSWAPAPHLFCMLLRAGSSLAKRGATFHSLSNHIIIASGICLRVLACVPADITLTAYSYERILAEETNADTDRHAVGLHMLDLPAVGVILPAAYHTVQCGGGFLPFGQSSHLLGCWRALLPYQAGSWPRCKEFTHTQSVCCCAHWRF